jgi:tripartite-type tricarboxylate transporter receptor subunit TctC
MKRTLAFLLILGLSCAGVQAGTEIWPQRTVRIVLPLSAGGPTDVAARLFAERLAQRWHQPVIVENRPGVDGIVGVSGFVNAHDDHALLFSFAGPITINPLVYDKLPYDPARDLVPIAPAIDNFFCIAVSTTVDVTSVQALIALARAQPGKLNWAATAGLPQYIFAALQKSAQIELTQVPYRDFGPALQDFAQGRLQALAVGPALVLPQVAAGRARLLMVTNRQRSPLAPEVPTAREAGFPELEFEGVVGFYGWRDMPRELRERVAADVKAAGSDPALVQRLGESGVVVRTGGPTELAEAIKAQGTKVRALIPPNAAH